MNEKNQPRFKETTPNKDVFNVSMVNVNGGSSFYGVKPTCARCGKNHFGKCLTCTDGCFGFCKDGHKLRVFPTIVARGRESKKVPPSAQNGDAPKGNRFYVLQDKANLDEDASKL